MELDEQKMSVTWGSDKYELLRCGSAAALVGENSIHICSGTEQEIKDFFEQGCLTSQAGRRSRGTGADLLRLLRAAVNYAKSQGWEFMDADPCHSELVDPYRRIASKFGATEFKDWNGDTVFRLHLHLN